MKLAFFNFFIFIAIASVQSQLIPFLNEIKVNAFQKSFVLGISALIAFGLAIIIGKISDSIGKIKPSLIFCLILYNFFFSLAIGINVIWIQIIALALMFACLKQVMSCAETMVFQLKPKTFGKYHAISAIGLVVGSLMSGWLHQNISPTSLVIMSVVFSSISLIFVGFIHESENQKQKVTVEQIKRLLKNKDYCLFLLIFFFLMMIGFADQFIVTDKLLELGATKTILAIKFAIQSLMEIPIYYTSDRIFKRFSIFYLLLFACMMSGIKFFLYGFVQEVPFILLISTLQIVTHPLISCMSKILIQNNTPNALQTTSQLVGFAVYFSLAGFFTPLLGQLFVNKWGTSITLYFFASLAVFPFLLSFIMKNKMSYGKVSKGDKT